jgi:urocanate hydratase
MPGCYSVWIDMAIQNVIGDSFRGATWVSIHNGGGVGWGEVINGGFGLVSYLSLSNYSVFVQNPKYRCHEQVLDGSADAQKKAESMLNWDVNNGVARRYTILISIAATCGTYFALCMFCFKAPGLVVKMPCSPLNGTSSLLSPSVIAIC